MEQLFVPATKSKSEWKTINFIAYGGRRGWSDFTPGMKGYKDQVVALVAALWFCRNNKKSR